MTLNYIYIFGYGSLISPRGINGRGLKKIYHKDDIQIAHLTGYSRQWNALWHNNLYLGLSPNPKAVINGVIFKLYEEDITPFLVSEGCADFPSLYTLTDVTKVITPVTLLPHPEDRIFTLVTNNPTTEGTIPQYYINLLKSYLSEYDESFKEEFYNTTLPIDPTLWTLRNHKI